jgi:hypothetical protein
MIRCKRCKKPIVENGDSKWVHENDSECPNAEPEKFCTSCGEPQYDSETCGCGYKYEIREI